MSRAVEAAQRMWNHHGHQVYDFGLLFNSEVLRIRQATGLDLSGFTRFMATRGVRHVRKNHTDPERETAQQQFPVKPSDFALIPEIAAMGSMCLIGSSGSRKPTRLEHRTVIDDRVYVYLETIGMNDKRLELWTMRIERLDKGKV